MTKKVFLICETCGSDFWVWNSRIKDAEKKGFKVRYCSSNCYSREGQNNRFAGRKHTKESLKKMAENPSRVYFGKGKDNPNYERFGTVMGYKTLSKHLRKTIFNCQACGWGDAPQVLEIHHMDRNPLNNNLNNVKLLCPNCHSIEHFKAKDGKFARMKL
jgi:5-methylcytosine-specific restriction endonuclease McrA